MEMLPPTIFFFVVFHVVAFARALIVEEYDVSLSSTVTATIGAIIVGKAILIANNLPLLHWFRETRLVINVIWRTLIYVMLVILFQFLEELIPLVSRYGTILTTVEHLFEEINWQRFWATHIIFVVFLVFYNLATAVIDTFGRDELINAFFGTKSDKINKLD